MRKSERGATAIIVAIVIAVLCGFVALSLDVGHLYSVRGELQNGADAAALAGAKRLNGSNQHFELAMARADAQNFARNHPTDTYDVEPSVIELGQCVEKSNGTYSFTAIPGNTEEDALKINAVRVVTKRTGDAGGIGGGAVPLAFGAFVGKNGPQEVSAEAIALTGSPCKEGCPELPFALKYSCVADGGKPKCGASGPALFYVGLSSSGVDSGGLTVFAPDSSWGTSSICPVLQGACEYGANVGDPISIKNGDNIVGGNCDGSSLCYAIRARVGTPRDTGQVPLIEYSAGENCAGGFKDFNYNQIAVIKRIGTVRLVGAMCGTGPSKGAKAAAGFEDAVAKCGFVNSCFVLEFLCDQTDDDYEPVGCGWSGTAAAQPVLVR